MDILYVTRKFLLCLEYLGVSGDVCVKTQSSNQVSRTFMVLSSLLLLTPISLYSLEVLVSSQIAVLESNSLILPCFQSLYVDEQN